jgi:hypothetical protein
MAALAERTAASETAVALDVYSRRAVGHGGRAWTVDELAAPGGLRLYHATAVSHYVLDERDHRVRVRP